MKPPDSTFSSETPACAERRASRPRILIVTDYYLPGYRGGGPIRSIANLTSHLANDFEFRIVTQDRDLGDRDPYPEVRTGEWLEGGTARVRYEPRYRSILTWMRLLRETPYDLLYLNSVFSRATITLLFARRCGLTPDCPIVLAPRGELSPGALGMKARRKRLYLAAATRMGLFDGLTWQASAELERSEILQVLGHEADATGTGTRAPRPRGRVQVAVDLPQRHAANLAHRRIKSAGEARVIFISRLVRKKNLHYALDLLSRVRGRIGFDVYGPVEDDQYWCECQARMARLPANIDARYCGEVRPSAVAALFAEYDLFLFPTLSENFGYVVLEALMSGCPVLMSDTTPWRQLAERNAGWDLPLDAPERFVLTLEHVVEMDQAAYAKWRDGASELARAVASDEGAVQANVNLFRRALREGPAR